MAFLTERGIEGATLLEIGDGVGEIQVELLRRRAARATNLEISINHEAEAWVVSSWRRRAREALLSAPPHQRE